jgi:hypothetical protein
VSSGTDPDDAVASPDDGAGSFADQSAFCDAFKVTGLVGQSVNEAVGDRQSILPETGGALETLPTLSALDPAIENAPVLGSTFDELNVLEAVSDVGSTPVPGLPSASRGSLPAVKLTDTLSLYQLVALPSTYAGEDGVTLAVGALGAVLSTTTALDGGDGVLEVPFESMAITR